MVLDCGLIGFELSVRVVLGLIVLIKVYRFGFRSIDEYVFY